MVYINRCCDCNKFKKWEELNYVEDISYSGNVDDYHLCDECMKNENKDFIPQKIIVKSVEIWPSLAGDEPLIIGDTNG